MANVFTGNVYISTSREAIRKIFFPMSRVSSFQDSLNTLSEEDLQRSFVVTPTKNTNLLELDYSLTNENGPRLTLKFLETDSLFELFFVGKSPNTTILQQLYEGYNTLRPADRRKIEGTLFDAQSRLNPNYSDVYIAFGVGDNTKTWAGPFVTRLIEANLNTTADGVKEVELVFGRTEGFLRANSVELDRQVGLGASLNRYSRVINQTDVKIEATHDVPEDKVIGNEGEILKELVRDYLYKITGNGNSLAILPDISNKAISYIIALEKKKLAISSRDAKAQAKEDDSFLGMIKRGLERSAKFLDDISEDLVGVPAGLTGPYNPYPTEILGTPEPITFAKQEEGYKKFFALFGIEVTRPAKNSKFILKDGRGYVDSDARAEGSVPKDEKPGIIRFKMFTNKKSNDSEYRNLPDPFVPLQKVKEGLQSMFEGEGLDIEFFEETGLKTLKLWRNYGFVDDAFRPAYVFGSKKTVNLLLYLTNITSLLNIDSPPKLNNITKEDFDRYFNVSYRKDYYNEFLTTPVNSSFEEDVLKEDELAFSDQVSDLIASGINTFNIPVFRYNLNNPNVLGISVNYNASYLSLFNLGLRQKSLIPFVNSKVVPLFEELSQIVPSNVVRQVSNLVDKEGLEDDKEIYTFILKELLGQRVMENPEVVLGLTRKNITDTLTRSQLAIYITLLLDYNTNISKKPFIEVTDSSMVSAQKELLEELNKLAVSVEIKTLPFFALNTLGKNCLLLAANNSIIGFEEPKKQAPFSKNYVITGFRHFMSGEEMYSEFGMINPGANDAITQSIDEFGVGSVKDLIYFLEKIQKDKAENNSDTEEWYGKDVPENYNQSPGLNFNSNMFIPGTGLGQRTLGG